MNEASKYTALVMAFGAASAGGESPSPTWELVQTLSEYQLSILEFKQILVRDRHIITALLEIHPDHARALEEDLNSLATRISYDIACDFQPFIFSSEAESAFLGKRTVGPAVILAGSSISASALASFITVARGVESSFSSLEAWRHGGHTTVEIGFSELSDGLAAAIAAHGREIGVAQYARRTHEPAPRLIVLDMDSTCINEEVIDELARARGVYEEVAQLTASAMAGDIDFQTALHERVGLLSGLSNEALSHVRSTLTITPGLQSLVSWAHSCGHVVAVVSGGFHNVIDPLLKDVGVDYIFANTLETSVDGVTGKLVGEIITAQRKADFLQEMAAQKGIPLDRTVAVGDGANDIPMVKLAGTGIAFCAKPALREVADVVISERNLALVATLIGDAL